MPSIAVHAFVSGKVQGVFFRKYTHETAVQLGLTGWVRNTEDDRVELFAQGDQQKVEALLLWCKTKGSPKSRPTGVETEPAEIDATLKDFRVVKE